MKYENAYKALSTGLDPRVITPLNPLLAPPALRFLAQMFVGQVSAPRRACRTGHQTGTVIAGRRCFPKTLELQCHPLSLENFFSLLFIESC